MPRIYDLSGVDSAVRGDSKTFIKKWSARPPAGRPARSATGFASTPYVDGFSTQGNARDGPDSGQYPSSPGTADDPSTERRSARRGSSTSMPTSMAMSPAFSRLDRGPGQPTAATGVVQGHQRAGPRPTCRCPGARRGCAEEPPASLRPWADHRPRHGPPRLGAGPPQCLPAPRRAAVRRQERCSRLVASQARATRKAGLAGVVRPQGPDGAAGRRRPRHRAVGRSRAGGRRAHQSPRVGARAPRAEQADASTASTCAVPAEQKRFRLKVSKGRVRFVAVTSQLHPAKSRDGRCVHSCG